jgi:hypothetical protein
MVEGDAASYQGNPDLGHMFSDFFSSVVSANCSIESSPQQLLEKLHLEHQISPVNLESRSLLTEKNL